VAGFATIASAGSFTRHASTSAASASRYFVLVFAAAAAMLFWANQLA
jgi:hypothetical protein